MAEENNNIETLSYKISVDTSGLTKAEEKVRSLKDASKDLKDELGRPINPEINVEKINDVAKAMDKGAKSAKEFTNATANLGKTTGSGGMESVTKATEKLNTTLAKAKMGFSDLKKILDGLDDKGIGKVAKEIDSILPTVTVDSKMKSVKEAMKFAEEMGHVTKGSSEYNRFQRTVVEGFVEVLSKAGVELKSLQATVNKPITVKTDTKPIKEISTESAKAESSVKKLNNTVENLGKAPAKSGAKKVTKEIEEIELKAVKAGQSIKQMVKSLDVRGVEKVVHDVNTAFGWDSTKNAGEPSPVEQVMSNIMRERQVSYAEGSKEYMALEQEVAADLAMQVKTMGGELPSLGITRQLDTQANQVKKVASNVEDAKKALDGFRDSVNKTGKVMSNREYAKFRKELEKNPAAFERMASEFLGEKVSVFREQLNMLSAESRRARGGSQTPKAQRRRETDEQIADVQNKQKVNTRRKQKAENTVARFNRQQQEANSIMSSLFGGKVTRSNIDEAFEAVEKRLGKKIPKEYYNVPKHQTLDRARYLQYLSDVASGKKEETPNSIMRELYGKRVTKANIDKAFREVEGKLNEQGLLKGKVGKEYKAIPAEDTLERAKYLRGVMEKYEEASQQQLTIEKKASESVKKEVEQVADTKTKAAKETTDTVAKESKKQADVEIASAKKATAETKMTWKDIEKTFQNMSNKDINKYAKDVDKFWKEYYKDRRGKKQTVNELTKELAGADVRQGSDAWYDSKREALFKLTKQMMRAKYELESLQKAEKSETETVKGNTKAISENNEAVAKGRKGKKGKDSEKAPKMTDEEWKAFKEKHQADVAHLPTKKEQNQALYKMLQEEKKANAEVGKSATESAKENKALYKMYQEGTGQIEAETESVKANTKAVAENNEVVEKGKKSKRGNTSKVVEQTKAETESVKENTKVVANSKASIESLKASVAKMSHQELDAFGAKVDKYWVDFRQKNGGARSLTVDELTKYSDDYVDKNTPMWYGYKSQVLQSQIQRIAGKEGGLEALQSMMGHQQVEAEKKASESVKKEVEQVANAKTEATNKTEQAETKKSNARKKSASQSKKSSEEEVKADEKVAQTATEAAKKVEQAETKKSNARKKSASQSKRSAVDDEEAKKQRIAKLQGQADEFAAGLKRNMDSASHNGHFKSFENYEKIKARERKVIDQLATYGVQREPSYNKSWDDYVKEFNSNSSIVQAKAAKAAKKVAAQNAKNATTALESYIGVRDRYLKNTANGKVIEEGQYTKMQRQLAEARNVLEQNGKEVPSFNMPSRDIHVREAEANRARIQSARELKDAENDIVKIRQKQISLITRGKQLTDDQYRMIKTTGEEAQKRAKAAGSQQDISMPFDNPKYGNVTNFNREAIIQHAMSWNHQGVDSYSNSINRLIHAQEALYSAYQRDPHPKYLQMLGKTRAELSKVTEEYKKYQHQINDTGTTYDKFMMRARSHLEWIASGAALSAVFVFPTMFANTLENLEARMAGIKQVIPMIEGLEDNQFGSKEMQLTRAKKEMQDLINIAAKYGAGIDEVMEATRSIGRMYGQGSLGVTNTNLMATQATRMAVADAFDLIDATRGLESAMSQWNLQTENTADLLINTNRILDVWTKTAHRGAASAQDIADAIQLAGTAANQAGVSFEFFNALVATGVRATARSGNEIGTSLKSMMVSMQTEKAEKALKQWGISLREIGEDGVMRMRNLEDVILDVSMLVQSTEKDTSKLLLALSGGKFQYSKVSAILKNGDELMRMLKELNNPDTVGFTSQQIEVQLDTLSRKLNTIKDDLQGLVFNVGGIESIKEFADMVDRVILGLSSMAKSLDSNAVSMAATVVKWGVLYRVITKVVELVGVAYQSFKILSTAQVTSTVATQGFLGVLQSLFTGFINNTKALATGRMARAGYTVETKKSEVATNQDTVATEANTAAHDGNTIAINANTVSYKNNTVAQAALIGGASKGGKALGAFGKAARLAGGAVAALGGPIGVGIMLLTVAIPLLYEYASALGEVENETRKKVETLNKDVELTEQQIQKVAQSTESMKRLARVYNEIADSLENCTEGTKEYTVKQQQLKSIEESIMSVVGQEADIFDTNHRIRMNALDEWMKTYVAKKREEQEEQLQTAIKHKEATESELEDTKRRIEALSSEQRALKATGSTWNWFSKMLTQAHMIAGQAMKDLGDFTKSETLKKMGEDAIESSRRALTGAGGEGSGDLDVVEAELKRMRELEMQQEETKTELNGKILMLQQSLLHGDNPNPHNPEERGTVEPDEEGGKGHGSGGSGGSGSGGKSRLPYESDELAAAIHEAAQTQYAKDNSLTEPLLRGLADVQSGLSQDFNDGVRIGAFGVTEEMGKRFGQDVYTPIGNAMTAVLSLTQKISDAGGDMGAALNSFTGGNVSGVYAAMKQQQDTYNFDGSDYFGSSDFGADVIAAARQRLGLPYGGSDLSDEFQAVCTTFVQRALVDAGADEDIVRGLTADANNWAKNAGAAFHPYGDGYAPKPGDIALTNIDASGHSGHANIIDENGTGYYSAGGSAGESAHYDTPIEVAYEDDIEGYIDVAALTGKTRGLGLRSKGSNARKSVFDFRRSAYERLMYQIQKAKEDYEDEAKDIELERALTGNSYDLAAREQLNEQAKLTVEQNTLKLLEKMYKGVQKSIENTIKNAPDLQVALGQEGAKWADLVPEEKKQLASLYKNDNGVFAELVNEEIKLHDALREQHKVVKEQSLKTQKYLHMSIEEAAKFEIERLQMKYENLEANTPDNDSNHLRGTKMNRAKQEMLRGQIAAQTTVRDYAYNQYVNAVARDKAELEKLRAEIQSQKDSLATLQQQEANGQDVSKAIEALNSELTKNIRLYEALGKYGSDATVKLEKGFYDADTALRQMEKTLENVAKEDLKNVRNRAADMFTDLIVEGKSFSDVWESLWKDLARYTINAILGASNNGNIWTSIFGLFTGSGGSSSGTSTASGFGVGGLATGGRIPGYTQGGGMIKGAGTGTSDSILAYLANKDRFVYLSNGEYVMTAEATKRLGVENLDALNGYADGGALTPIPYVPTLSNRASKRVGSLSNKNPNARMEQLMQEQTNVIQSLSGGNGQVVVLNTKASSADVLRAMQENPRQVQAILGQQRRAGFK